MGLSNLTVRKPKKEEDALAEKSMKADNDSDENNDDDLDDDADADEFLIRDLQHKLESLLWNI